MAVVIAALMFVFCAAAQADQMIENIQ